MRVLLGTIIAGHSKDYAIPKFEEMCRDLLPDVDVVVVVEPGVHPTGLPCIADERISGTPWATEIVYYGKQLLGHYALEWGYDALIWQGIDCYYHARRDFDLLVEGGESFPIVGGLIAGRNLPDYAVCRTFVGDTFEQRDAAIDLWPKRTLACRGYIGSDATLIRRDALETVSMAGYQHWHLRKDRDPNVVGPEEYFMWSAINRHHIVPVVDTRVRPWHFHETGLGARYPGETCGLDDLRWG